LIADYGALIIIALCLYILFFASGLGATPWAINSEVILFYISVLFCCTEMYSKTRLSSDSIARLPPFGPIEGHKWFDQITSQ
jgi:hypothetical protein